MLIVYRIDVEFYGNMRHPNHLFVRKDVIKCHVVKTGRDYLHLSSALESYYKTEPVKVPIDECYSTEEDARRHADEKANELIAKLMEVAAKLKEPAKLFDRIGSTKVSD